MENKKELNEEKLTSLKDETVEDVAGGLGVGAAVGVARGILGAEADLIRGKAGGVRCVIDSAKKMQE